MSRPILVTHTFNVPAERLFGALDDNATMGRWLGVKVELIKKPARQGRGAPCVASTSGLQRIDEEILEREVPRRIVYKIVRGLFPLSSHRGEIHVTSLGPDRSSVEWKIELESMIPGLGQLVRAGLGLGIQRALKKLAGQLRLDRERISRSRRRDVTPERRAISRRGRPLLKRRAPSCPERAGCSPRGEDPPLALEGRAAFSRAVRRDLDGSPRRWRVDPAGHGCGAKPVVPRPRRPQG